MDLITQAMSSPWLYVALFTLAALDAFFIVLPSESAVITAGAFAVTGGPDLPWVVIAAAAGAMLGDHLGYGLGRRYGARRKAAGERLSPGRGPHCGSAAGRPWWCPATSPVAAPPSR
jgi:membrane protein DedA with SNARE-associated domain